MKVSGVWIASQGKQLWKVCVCVCVFWELCRYPLLTGELQSTQRTVTFSRTSPPSFLPQVMWKSVCSLRAERRASMVSGGICTINPSAAGTRAGAQRANICRAAASLFINSTLDNAGLGDEAGGGLQGSVEHHEAGSGHCRHTPTRGTPSAPDDQTGPSP